MDDMNAKEMKKPYIAPKLTVVSFRMERGYAMSSLSIEETARMLDEETMQLLLDNNGGSTGTMETFDFQSGWGEENATGFWTEAGGYF